MKLTSAGRVLQQHDVADGRQDVAGSLGIGAERPLPVDLAQPLDEGREDGLVALVDGMPDGLAPNMAKTGMRLASSRNTMSTPSVS